MPETRVQDEQGNIHVFPDGSTPEMIAQAMGVQAPRPDFAANPPGIKAPPQPEMSPSFSTMGFLSGLRGSHGEAEQQTYREHPALTGAAGVGGLALGAGLASPAVTGAVTGKVLPFLGSSAMNAVKAVPVLAAMEGINYARKNLKMGKYIPAGAEWLPMFMGGKGRPAAAAEAEEGAALQGSEALGKIPVRNARPTVADEPPPTWNPQTKQKLGEALNEATGAAPQQPNVPLRQQLPFFKQQGAQVLEGHTPVESSAMSSYRHLPETNELEIAPKGGTPIRYGDVSPEQAQTFINAESKGKAWQAIRQNSPVVAKHISGEWKPVTPTAQSSASPESPNLLEQLKQSVAQVESQKIAHTLGKPISLDLDPQGGRIGARYPILDAEGNTVGNITATRDPRDPNSAVHITGIGSGQADLTNKLGNAFVKQSMRQIMEDAGATRVKGMRVGGAKGRNIGKTQVEHSLQ